MLFTNWLLELFAIICCWIHKFLIQIEQNQSALQWSGFSVYVTFLAISHTIYCFDHKWFKMNVQFTCFFFMDWIWWLIVNLVVCVFGGSFK